MSRNAGRFCGFFFPGLVLPGVRKATDLDKSLPLVAPWQPEPAQEASREIWRSRLVGKFGAVFGVLVGTRTDLEFWW